MTGARPRIFVGARLRAIGLGGGSIVSTQALGTIFILLALLCWAGNALIGRTAPDAQIPPIALNFWRWVVALAVLAPFAIPKLRAQWPLFRTHWWLWCVFGVVTVAGFNAVFYVALQYTTVVQGTLISGVLPVLVLITARIFLAQPITPRQLAGVLISIAGVAVIVTRGDPQMLLHLRLNIGDLWMLLAVCLWAAQTILIRFLPKAMDLMAFQIAAIVAGLAAAAPCYLLETASGYPMPLTLHAALAVAYTGVIASALGFTFWNMGVIRAGAKNAGYLGNLYPVFSASLGILVLGEPLHWYHALGALVIFAGIYLATVATGAERRDAPVGR
jgi:drug/metabolite transporter (DMT)-like permease